MPKASAGVSGKMKLSSVAATTYPHRSVVIHVFDEYRKSTKDFLCQRDLLLTSMKYFQAYLTEANEHDEIDISVHCDVEIFELLMEYMQQRDNEWRPRITLENIASILVSSEFLQMDDLVEECVHFISGRVQEFMLLRVDFDCLSDATVAKIANNCTPEQLQKLRDPKDKILSKLRRKKVETLVRTLQDDARRLELCEHCETLFLKDDANSAGCRKGKRQVGVHGELVGWHQAKAGWQVEVFLRELGANKGISWSAVYWYIWGSTNCFCCSVCKQKCSFLELQECPYHSGTVIDHGPGAKYSCCSARIFSADEISVRGCKMKPHMPLHEEHSQAVGTFSDIVELPKMWEMIRVCERVARAQGSPLKRDAGADGRVDVASLFSRPEGKSADHDVWSQKHHELGLSTKGNTSGCRQQFNILQLQEKDRVRCQEIARVLMLQRKKLTS